MKRRGSALRLASPEESAPKRVCDEKKRGSSDEIKDSDAQSSSSEEEGDEDESWMDELDLSLTQVMNAQQARVKDLQQRVLAGDLLRVVLSFARELGSARCAGFHFLELCTEELRGRARALLGRTLGNMKMAAMTEIALFKFKVSSCKSSSSYSSSSSASRSLGLSGKNGRNYSHTLRSLRRNLSDIDNSLKQDVLNGDILLEDLVRMAPSELASSALKAERAKQKKIAQDERRISDELRHYKSGTSSDRFLCDRCGSRRSMYRFVYRNNSHQSSRIIVHCLDCQHKYQHFGLIPERESKVTTTHHESEEK